MKHDNRMITAGILVMNKACAPAVATVPIVLVVSVVEAVAGTVPAVNAMAVTIVPIVPVVSIVEAVATGLGVNKIAMLLVAVATVPIILEVSAVEAVADAVPAVNVMAVAIVPVVSVADAVATGLGVNKIAMLLVVEPSVVNGLAHSPGKGTPQLAHSAAVV